MKELMCFLRRRAECVGTDRRCPVIIPFFYRLGITELYDEPRLDRRDRNGNLLYRQSRFYERQHNGEPEANIESIKASLMSLRGIMGIRNDVDASNDSAYIMSRRRAMLLRELCEKVEQAVLSRTVQTTASNTTTTTTKRDEFHKHFDAPYDVSELVFDFESKNENGCPSTREGRFLAMVLNESQGVNRTIAVRGIGGAGKTSLLRGIRSLKQVEERFQDGVYNVSLGMDATRGKLIEALSMTVQVSGGEETANRMRRETDVAKVFDLFQSWFAGKQCLFVLDDVCETKEISAGTIDELLKVHVSGRDSKVVLTTRSVETASKADTYYALEPRGSLESVSRRILLQYSRIEPEQGRNDDQKAVDEVLRRCAGLPLFLAVAGKAVRGLSCRRGNKKCEAYRVYSRRLNENMQSLLNTDVGWYGGLYARLLISLDLLEGRTEALGFRVSVNASEMHRRLSVLKKQARVPMSMLKHLWELEGETEVAIIAQEFEAVGLADVEYETRGSDTVELLRLHDSLHEFAVMETRKRGEDRVGHETLLSKYGEGLVAGTTFDGWWHPRLDPDGYMHENVCRHLLGAKRASELVELLLKPQWAERQVNINGVPFLKDDLSLGIEVVREEMVGYSQEGSETEEALQLILDAVTLSAPFISKGSTELWFQLHGRLKKHRNRLPAIREYVGWIETQAPRPKVLCLNDFLAGPGGSSTKIISVGVPVLSVVMLDDGERVACGCTEGLVVVVNFHRSAIEMGWMAHNESTWCIAVGRNGTRLVSGSWDGTAKVWEVATGGCVAVFEGDTDAVMGVEVLKDEKRVVSVSWVGSAQIWEMDTGRRVLPPFRGHEGPVRCVAVLGDKDEFITGGADGTLRRWSSTTGAQVGDPFMDLKSPINCVAVTPDGCCVVSGSKDRAVRTWDIGSHEQTMVSLKGHNYSVTSVAVSRDGHGIVSGSRNGTVRVWDANSGQEVCDALEGHGQMVGGLLFLGSVDCIVSCSFDGAVRLWDVRRKKENILGDRHNHLVGGVWFTPNGKLAVSGSWDKTARVWEATSGRQIGDAMEGHSDLIRDVAVTRNGLYVVTVSNDKTIGVWDFESRKLLCRLTGHSDGVRSG